MMKSIELNKRSLRNIDFLFNYKLILNPSKMNIERLQDINEHLFAENDLNGECIYYTDEDCQTPFNRIVLWEVQQISPSKC